MRANKPSKTDRDYSLEAAIQYYRNCITQQLKNRHSSYHACTVLKMLGKKQILTNSEVNDLRKIKLDSLAERIVPHTGQLLPSTQRVYINTAKHAIGEFLGYTETTKEKVKS
jgi:hypothetical protein